MNWPRMQRVPDWGLLLVGFALGYVAFAVGYYWSEGAELWASFGIGLPLHAPVAIMYGAVLMFLHRRWSTYVTRPALFLCGVVTGLFPFFGVFPLYVWRLRYAVLLLGIHVALLTAVVVVNFAIARFTRRAHVV